MFPKVNKKDSVGEISSDTILSLSCLNSTGPSDNTLKSNFQRSRNLISSREFSSNLNSLREYNIPEESLESSSSVQLEDSQDILVLGRRKLHGCHDTFCERYAIKLKKLRKSRYSEHIPRKILHLQVDQDVQPEIASVKSSFISTERRERAVSCYTKPKIKASFVDIELVSQESNLKVSPRILLSDEEIEEGQNNYEEEVVEEEENCNKEENDLSNSEENNEGGHEYEDSENIEDNCSEIPEVNENQLERVESDQVSRSRSIDIVVEINGKVFKYFDRQVLCQIHVISYSEAVEGLQGVAAKFRFKKSWKIFCCVKNVELTEKSEKTLEKLIEFSMNGFEFVNEFHLKILLGAYCKVTRSNDWPSNDEEWLDMGFATTDLAQELQVNGPIGLLYIFFLADQFSQVLQEMLSVCRYFSYEVFNVCKFFVVETMRFVKKKGLHKVFKPDDDIIAVTFGFCTGMLIKWFEMMTQNQDFDESFRKVTRNAEKDPSKFLKLAEKYM